MGQPHDDDAYWRRPPGSDPASTMGPPESARPWSGSTGGVATPAPYAGPPRTAAPPPGWRPPVVVQPHAPRALPAQDQQAIDRAEQAARTVTMGVGLVAGAVLVVLMLILCGRWLF